MNIDINSTSDDFTRPPLFSPDEWRRIVDALFLSPRQASVVGLAIQGKQDKEISAALGIGATSVRKYLAISKRKLAVEDRMGLAYRVFETFRRLDGL